MKFKPGDIIVDSIFDYKQKYLIVYIEKELIYITPIGKRFYPLNRRFRMYPISGEGYQKIAFSHFYSDLLKNHIKWPKVNFHGLVPLNVDLKLQFYSKYLEEKFNKKST